MWVKRTEKEFKAERFRRWRNAYAFWLPFLTFFISINTKLGWDKASSSFSPISWKDFFYDFPVVLTISALFALLITLVPSYLQAGHLIVGGTALSICEKCGKVKLRDRLKECKCGGKFLNEIEMKWIEPEET